MTNTHLTSPLDDKTERFSSKIRNNIKMSTLDISIQHSNKILSQNIR